MTIGDLENKKEPYQKGDKFEVVDVHIPLGTTEKVIEGDILKVDFIDMMGHIRFSSSKYTDSFYFNPSTKIKKMN